MSYLKQFAIVVGAILFVGLVGALFTAVFSDRYSAQKYEDVLHLRSSDVLAIHGEPDVKGGCSGNDWVPGVSKPSMVSCDAFWAYQERYGYYYIFFSDEDRVIAVQYRGG